MAIYLYFVRSESVRIRETETGAEIQTQTGWISQEMFTMSYGKGPFTGMMTSLCTRPAYDTVMCRVEEKGWNLTTMLVFSQRGMINERLPHFFPSYFI